jgi:hypothetical protein
MRLIKTVGIVARAAGPVLDVVVGWQSGLERLRRWLRPSPRVPRRYSSFHRRMEPYSVAGDYEPPTVGSGAPYS